MRVSVREKCCRFAIVFLCHVLALQTVFGQQAPAPRQLKIAVVEGEGAKNVAQQISAKAIIVRIVDENDRPVEGATVAFIAPEGGPSGEFANDSRTLRVMSGPDGLANAGPYHPNDIEGPYQIQVRAEFQGVMARIVISQMNVAQGKGHKKLIAIVAIGGAAVAAAVAARGKGSSSSNTPTITFGGGAVGAPK